MKMSVLSDKIFEYKSFVFNGGFDLSASSNRFNNSNFLID